MVTLNPALKIRTDILRKAARYGVPDEPFLIALWSDMTAELQTPELDALFGTRQWTPHKDGSVAQRRAADGIFTELKDGSPKWARISAVALLDTQSSAGTIRDSFLIYHNPHASRPLAQGALAGCPQLVSVGGAKMQWQPSPTAEDSVP